MPTAFDSIDKILVIKLRNLGDVLLATPVFRALRRCYPGASVSALVNLGTEEALAGNPLIDEVLVYDRTVNAIFFARRFFRQYSFLKLLRGKRFDLTVDLTGGRRTASVSSFITGARYRLGEASPDREKFYTHAFPPDKGKHTVLRNLSGLQRFGINARGYSVDFHPSGSDREFARKTLDAHGASEGSDTIHIHPVSRWHSKCWKDDHMARVVDWLTDRKLTVVITSSADAFEVAKTANILSLARSSSKIIDLSGRTTIGQLGAMAGLSRLFLGLDSAPLHLAAASGTPVLALFGPSSAFHWGPWDNRRRLESIKTASPYPEVNGVQESGAHTVVQRDWKCVPCERDGCEGSGFSRCLQDIKPEEMIDVIASKLDIKD